jgi:hypothetical protein
VDDVVPRVVLGQVFDRGAEDVYVRLVALHVVGVPVRVHHVANGLVRGPLDLLNQVVGPHGTQVRVHHQHVVFVHQDGGVAECSVLPDGGVHPVCHLGHVEELRLAECGCCRKGHEAQKRSYAYRTHEISTGIVCGRRAQAL